MLHNILSSSLQSPSRTLEDHLCDLCSVMPLKKFHYIPCHEKNIFSVDYSWNRPSKTHAFGLALAGSYGLTPIREINNRPHAHWHFFSMSCPHRTIFGNIFKYISEFSIANHFVSESAWVVRLNNVEHLPLASCSLL